MRRGGFLVTDLLVAIGLALTIILIFTAALRQYSAGQDDADVRRMLRAEAENYLHRLRVMGVGKTPHAAGDARSAEAASGAMPGAAIEAAGDALLEQGSVISVSETRGAGAWDGFTLVRVTAKRRVLGGRWISVDLATYIRRRGGD